MRGRVVDSVELLHVPDARLQVAADASRNGAPRGVHELMTHVGVHELK